MWLIWFAAYSIVCRRGRFCFITSFSCTQSVRLMVPGFSQPMSYLPEMKAAMREALSSSTVTSTRSM